jgi:hypothetical protein
MAQTAAPRGVVEAEAVGNRGGEQAELFGEGSDGEPACGCVHAPIMEEGCNSPVRP